VAQHDRAAVRSVLLFVQDVYEGACKHFAATILAQLGTRTYAESMAERRTAPLVHHVRDNAMTFVGHSMGGAVAYLLAMQRADQVERLIVEDVPPPFRRDRPIPDRPVEPLDFDWAVVPAIVGQVNAGDPVAWDGLRESPRRHC